MDNYLYLDGNLRQNLNSGQNGPQYYQTNTASARPYLMPTPRPKSNYYYINSAGLANPYYGGYFPNQLDKPADYFDDSSGGRRNGNKIAVAIVVVLLGMAVITAVGLGVYFGIYAEKDTNTTSTTTASSTTTVMSTTTTMYITTTGQPTTSPIPTITLSGLLTLLDQVFKEALNDKTSNEFNNLASEFCENMNNISRDTSLKLVDCVVHNFINGSVKVNYTLYFENAENSEEPEYIQEVRQNASFILINGIKAGSGSLNLTEEDVEFNDDGDDCEFAGCENICTDTYFSFTCSCHAGFILADDEKACAGVAVYLTGVVILNETFADDLTDPTSDTYQRKATDVCSEIQKVFDSGDYAENFTACVVNNFLEGSIVVNLTLFFEVSSLADTVEFLENVREEIEGELENNNIFNYTNVVYHDFDNDIRWCYNNPSVCGQTGCDGIQCVCEEDEFYHGPSDCRDSSAFLLIPSYEEMATVYFSTEVVPDSSVYTSYHVIVCVVNTNHTNDVGDPLSPIWLDPEGNIVPFYPDALDINGVAINIFNFKDVLLHNGTWILESMENSYVRALAFSEPDSSDSGTYTCHVEGRPRIATFVNIEFIDCETDSFFACAGNKQCIPRAQLCDERVDCLNTDYKPNFLDEHFCNCTEEAFNCSNGVQCVPPEFHCDAYGNIDCEDGSDQENCDSACSDDTYSCTSGDRCIPLDWLCDGSPDCPDGDDENDATCSAACDMGTEYLCENSTVCISKIKLCDGYNNCPKGDDEVNCVGVCDAEETPCPFLEYVCIRSVHICDGIPDCPNGADEWYSICESILCDSFTCGLSGRCIRNSWVCDGWCDCAEDCSDELGCNCTTGFVCNNTQCLPQAEEIVFCDKTVDCLDGSDEPENCSCTANQFDCGDKCIPADRVCNGEYDCTSDSMSMDELNCTCEDFTCGQNGRCIRNSWVCDGWCDCAEDCSDELGCNCTTGFVCNSTQCLPWAEEIAFCDKEIDCFDGSDEPENCSCTANQFDCGHRCIPADRVCDGFFDCTSDSMSIDELNCTCEDFTCGLSGRCIRNISVCDGLCNCHEDCSDELGCDCTTGFACNNTQCLPWTEEIAFCDKEIDCFDGSDEPENCTCMASQFDCGNKCIPAGKVCDGISDCEPENFMSVDELDCNCTSAELFTCDNGKCVNPELLCNFGDDCGDFSDERNCSYCDTDNGWHVCEGHGMCVQERYICDGIEQCVNGFDELNCPECSQDTFKCLKKGKDQCLPVEWICDGVADCDNRQDELNCENCTEFSCNDYSQCFNFSQQCDRTQDCADGSDEWQCLRIDEDSGVLKYFDGASQRLIPVCGNLWDINNNQDICDKLGKGLSLGHEVVSNYGEDKYYIYGDTPHTGSMADCGVAVAVKVMCEELECGKRSDNLATGFIINGVESIPGQWPWQVTLFSNGRFICGGTLVHPYWVVTAAHCVYPPGAEVYTVRLGSILREAFDANALEIPVIKAITHPDYDPGTLINDIAVLKLAQKVVYSDYIRPACLPEQRKSPDSTSTCFSTGYGTINKVNPEIEEQITSDVLLQAKMTIHSNSECHARIGFEFLDPSMLCTGYLKGYKSICQGDSGGPLVCLNQFNTWDLVGVTSWSSTDQYTGIYCASYSGFADVSMFVNWIKQQMQFV